MALFAKTLLLFSLFGAHAEAANISASGITTDATNAKFTARLVLDKPKGYQGEFGGRGKLYMRISVTLENLGGSIAPYIFEANVEDPVFPYKVELADSDFLTPNPNQEYPLGVPMMTRAYVRYCEECGEVDDKLFTNNALGDPVSKKVLDFGTVHFWEHNPKVPPEELNCSTKPVFAGGTVKAAGKDVEDSDNLYIVFFRVAAGENTNQLQYMVPIALAPLKFQNGVANFSIPREKSFAPEYKKGFIFPRAISCIKGQDPAVCTFFKSTYAVSKVYYDLENETGKSLLCGNDKMSFTIRRR